MTSKQEKLAAARRKLKEFQGKIRETDISKHKTDILPFKSSKDSSHPSTESSPCCTPVFDENKNSEVNQSAHPYYINRSGDHKVPSEEDKSQRKLSDAFSNKSSSPMSWAGENQNIYASLHKVVQNEPANDISFFDKSKPEEELKLLYSTNPSGCLNGSNPSDVTSSSYQPFNCDNKINYQNKNYSSNVSSEGSDKHSAQLNFEKNFSASESVPSLQPNSYNYSEDFIHNEMNNSSAFNDIIKPLQVELQNHVQTITILVQQRNDAQNALSQAQSLLNVKSGEVLELNQHVTHLNSSLKELNQRLTSLEDSNKKLQMDNEQTNQVSNAFKARLVGMQIQFESKEEELMEYKRKYEESNKEHEKLLSSLNETQSQLSLCQIQLQQFTSGENSSLSIQVSQLQQENLNLKQKMEELERKMESEIEEKEQSSQKFHVYAQECNIQLSNLNSQLKTLEVENDKLKQENSILSKNLTELESVKENNSPVPESFKTEIADLHSQISVLSEVNNQLRNDLSKKEEELISWQNQKEEKELELKNLATVLAEVEADNRKLLHEVETPKGNERLLAAMESDKVAASKALLQNQKLKEQVVELEKGFMKISQEKLELTDQLAHEKHVNKELQSRLEDIESHHHHDHHDNNHHHPSGDHNCETDEKPEPPVNDSNEIEELRMIIRQLQEDKTELMGRLCSLTTSKPNIYDKSNQHEKHSNDYDHDHDHDHDHRHDHKHNHDYDYDHNHDDEEIEAQDAKARLQQMEEKVRKTMNEIAKLDEEKDKLEHLVLQLQGETETIGEYVTLYQTQRMLLRQRAEEKDNQLIRLHKDKEELRSKLNSLDNLVQSLLKEKESNKNSSGMTSETLSMITTPSDGQENNTAEKIRALINEIESTTLVNNHSVAFEHCSCCSGRLIVI